MRFVRKFKNNIECLNLWEVFSKGTLKEKTFALRLLKQAYDEIYIKTFPIPSEQESFDTWENSCFEMHKKKELDVQTFTIFGFDLASKPILIAFIATSFYKSSATGLIDYIVRLKDFRHILSALEICTYQTVTLQEICRKFDNTDLKMILWEANDPQKIEWDPLKPDYTVDCMDPQKRIDTIENHLNCARIGCDYVQVPIHCVKTDEEIAEGLCDNLLLYMYNAPTYQDATAEDLENWLCTFSKSLNGYFPNELNHPLISKMMKQVAYMKKKHVPILYQKQTPQQRKDIGCI